MQPNRLDRPVDPTRDHVLGGPGFEVTLTEYGSYTCPYCHAAHEVVADLRDRFGERMRYVFRHRPLSSEEAWRAAELAEAVHAKTGEFWPIHDALMRQGPVFGPGDLERIGAEFGVVDRPASARDRVEQDMESARASGARLTPTFFIGNRRYEGPWDESALSEAMLGSLGHRIHAASVDFARWGPSTGLLLLLMTILAVVVTNTPLGPGFEALWESPLGVAFGPELFALPLHHWINHGLLTVFFLVVGLEIKREFTVGRLATRRAAALPAAAALGGMVAPALLYLAAAPASLAMGWGVPIATDTAFAVALIVLLGRRVPVELRVFLTAAVIVDDLVAIAVVALFYSGGLALGWLGAAAAAAAGLLLLNRWGVYRPLPYAVLGTLLWLLLHESGVHATLAGVVLALATPTRPPANLRALLSQAEAVLREEMAQGEEIRHGPSEPAMRELDAIHDRIESPADKLLRSVEPWSSYFVLPLFALANAGVVLSAEIAHPRLVLAIVLGLVLGKPLGILAFAALAVRLGIAEKPPAYSWRQLAGAGALGGIGFTMSLFIAGQAFPDASAFVAAKIGVFLASLLAGAVGVAILWPAGRSASRP